MFRPGRSTVSSLFLPFYISTLHSSLSYNFPSSKSQFYSTAGNFGRFVSDASPTWRSVRSAASFVFPARAKGNRGGGGDESSGSGGRTRNGATLCGVPPPFRPRLTTGSDGRHFRHGQRNQKQKKKKTKKTIKRKPTSGRWSRGIRLSRTDSTPWTWVAVRVLRYNLYLRPISSRPDDSVVRTERWGVLKNAVTESIPFEIVPMPAPTCFVVFSLEIHRSIVVRASLFDITSVKYTRLRSDRPSFVSDSCVRRISCSEQPRRTYPSNSDVHRRASKIIPPDKHPRGEGSGKSILG